MRSTASSTTDLPLRRPRLAVAPETVESPWLGNESAPEWDSEDSRKSNKKVSSRCSGPARAGPKLRLLSHISLPGDGASQSRGPSSTLGPLDRLRENLQQKETGTGSSLPVIGSRTYHDVKEGLQKLSTLDERSAAAGTASDFNQPRLFSRRNSIKHAAGSLASIVSKPLRSIVERVSDGKVPEEARFEAERQQLLKDFRELKGGKTDLDLAQFQAALSVRGSHFAEALFRKLDAGGKGYVSDEELVNAILTLHCDTLENRIAFTFELLDTDDMGALSRKSLASMLKASCSESRISVDDTEADCLAATFFKQLGKRSEETISKQEFICLLQGDKNLQQSIKLAGINLKLPEEDRAAELKDIKRQTASLAKTEKFLVRFLHHFRISKPSKVFWLTVFCLAQVAGFVVAWTQTSHNYDVTFRALGWAYPVAKASAGAIQVVVALFLFPVARGMLTFIRSTPLKRVIPVDQSIQIHKFLAYCLFFWSWLHSLAHFVNSAHATQPGHLRGVYNKLLEFHEGCGSPAFRADNFTRGDFKAAGLPLAANSLRPTVSLSDYYGREVQITGVLLLSFMTIGYLWAMKYPRQSKVVKGTFLNKIFNSFSWFYATHLLMTIAVVTLLVFHPLPGLGRRGPSRLNCNGPAEPGSGDKDYHGTTWLYLLAGVVVFLIERTLRTWRRAAWDVSLQAVKIHGNSIIELRMTNPRRTNAYMARRFKCQPGQYCFLNIPKLSFMEWHPFSITSSPFDDHISFHIEAKGDWTRALKSLMQELTGESGEWTRFGKKLSHHGNRPCTHQSSLPATASGTSASELEGDNPFAAPTYQDPPAAAPAGHPDTDTAVLPEKPSAPDLEVGFQACSLAMVPRVAIDGPFGAPAQNFNDYEVLLLVGAGVGITPFASVLRTLVKEFEMAKCRRCGLANQHLFKPKKVYFHWVNREQQAPTWFQSTLEAIQSDEDVRAFLDIHIHFSPALASNDLRASIVKVAQELHHRQHGFDILSGCGLSTPISFGRPNWDKIFGNISADHPGKIVGTFYCGGPVLAKQLKGLCRTWNSKAGGKGFSFRRQAVADVEGQTCLVKPAKFDFFKESF